VRPTFSSFGKPVRLNVRIRPVAEVVELRKRTFKLEATAAPLGFIAQRPC